MRNITARPEMRTILPTATLSFVTLTTMLSALLVLGGTIVLLGYIAKHFHDIQERYPSNIRIVEPPLGVNNEDIVKAQYAKVWPSYHSTPTCLMRCVQDPDQKYILRTRTRDVYILPPRFMKEFAWLKEERACKEPALC